MMKSIISVVAVLLLCSSLHAQIIGGRITDEAGMPIASASVVLRTLSDSTFVDGTISGDDGKFVFSRNHQLPLRLEVSFLGYSTWIDTLHSVREISVVLQPSLTDIETVVVKGRRVSLIERKQGAIKVNVDKSYLQEEANMNKLLAKIPGLVVKDGSLGMFGKERLLVYVDGRKCLSSDEYMNLQPSDVASVEVIRSPSAEYEATADAVLHIRTNRRSFANTTTFSLSNESQINKNLDNTSRLSISHSTKRLAQTLTYRYNFYTGYDQRDIEDMYSTLPSLPEIHKQRDVRWDDKGNGHNLFYGLSFLASDRMELGLQYSGYMRDEKGKRNGTVTINSDGLPTLQENIEQNEDSDNQMHNVGMNASYKFTDNLKLSLMADYCRVVNDESEVISEQVEGAALRINTSASDNAFNILSVNPRLAYSGDNYSLLVGGSLYSLRGFSHVDYGGRVASDDIATGDLVGAAFVQADIETNWFDIMLGLRGEHSNSWQSDNGAPRLESTMNDLFPHIGLSKELDDWSASLSYRKSIYRPPLFQLRPQYSYRDTLTYLTGNPQLEPMRSHNIDFSLGYKSIEFEMGYYINKNSIYVVELQDTVNPSVLNTTYANMVRPNTVFHVGITYNFTYKIFTSMLSFMLDKPKTYTYYMDEYKLLDKPMWYINANANADLNDHISLSAAYQYFSDGDEDCFRYKSYSSLDLEMKLFFFKRALQVSLGVYDVFRTNQSNTWVKQTNYTRTEMHSEPDSRMFAVSLQYKFGGKARSVQSRSSSQSARSRAK